MAASFLTVQKRVTDILNAQSAGTWSTTIASTSLDRNANAITEAVTEAAMLIAKAILSNPKHVHRGTFISSSAQTLTHQGELPDMAGEMDLVEIQPYENASWETGSPRDAQQIEDYRATVTGFTNNMYDSIPHNQQGSRLSGFYAISNGRFYFTGYAARGYFPQIDRNTVTSQIPDEYQAAWLSLSIPLLIKEGDNLMDVAQHYLAFGQQELISIANMNNLAPLPEYLSSKRSRGNG